MTSAIRILCAGLLVAVVAIYGLDRVRFSHQNLKEGLQAERRDSLMRSCARESLYIQSIQRRDRRSVELLARSQGYHLEGESDWNAVSSINLYTLDWE
ncbi:MAG: hypothetical protein AB7F75_12610 [Planctomycetota bacterium]